MKKIVEQIRKKITFYNFFTCATIFGIIVLLFSVGINYKYAKDMTDTFEQRLVKIEEQVPNIDSKKQNKSILKNIEQEKDDFIKQYYTIQADWLNKWITALAIIMAVLGIMIPICFIKFLENKEKEMDRIIEDTKQQKEDMQLQVDEVSKKYNDIEKYVNEMRALSKYNEGLEMVRGAENDETKYDDVLRLYKEANELDKRNPKYLYAIGNLHLYRNKYNEAIIYLRKAIDIKQDAKYYLDLSFAYKAKKDFNKALKYANKALGAKGITNSLEIRILSNNILLYSEFNNKEKVLRNAQNLLNKNIETKEIHESIGLAYMNIREYEKAIEIFEKSNKKYYWSKSYYNLAEAYIFNKNFDKAWNLVQESLKDNNSNFKFIYNDDYEKWLSMLNEVNPQTEATIKIKEFIDHIEKKERKNYE